MARQRVIRTSSTIAVAYLRVSTTDQAIGLQAQQDAIARWAKSKRIEVVSWHSDIGVSGGATLDRRTGVLEALSSAADRGAGVLLVAKRDRLARDVMVAAMIERLAERQGARVVSADGSSDAETPEGELMRGIIDLFAQYERAVIRSRIRAAMTALRDRGERTGRPPFGWRVAADGRRLEHDPREQETLRRAQTLRREGQSFREVAERLQAEGHPCRGRRWHVTTIVRALRRAA